MKGYIIKIISNFSYFENEWISNIDFSVMKGLENTEFYFVHMYLYVLLFVLTQLLVQKNLNIKTHRSKYQKAQ